ncbi:SDR family oxidoreductase [Thermosporothrix hazakensis]|nr:SDR family oxidoreductase [Thermosporothrix hazakensis]GCE51430.1 3-ketoacyl-ACP reductase [Thermosporothrix hazakensis]
MMSESKRPLAGKVTIVTGSTRGIGRAIAQRLGREGAAVVVTYATNVDLAREVVQAIQQAGSEALALQMDLREIATIRHLFARTLNHFGKVDILVNNASGLATLKPTAKLTQAEYDSMFDLTRGVYFALQEAARHIADNGRIVSLSTAMTATGSPTSGAYVGSKAAIEQFSIALARELGWRGVTVNVVSPGVTVVNGNTHHQIASGRPLDASSLPQDEQEKRRLYQERMEQIRAATPLGRLGTPEDIANVVSLLVSAEAGWLTGQNIRAAGGIV